MTVSAFMSPRFGATAACRWTTGTAGSGSVAREPVVQSTWIVVWEVRPSMATRDSAPRSPRRYASKKSVVALMTDDDAGPATPLEAMTCTGVVCWV